MTEGASFLVATGPSGELELQALGELDLAYEEEMLVVMRDALDAGPVSQVVVDLTGLQFIDSSGLRAVLRCQQLLRARDLPMRLHVREGPVTRLFAVAGITHRFDYVED